MAYASSSKVDIDDCTDALWGCSLPPILPSSENSLERIQRPTKIMIMMATPMIPALIEAITRGLSSKWVSDEEILLAVCIE